LTAEPTVFRQHKPLIESDIVGHKYGILDLFNDVSRDLAKYRRVLHVACANAVDPRWTYVPFGIHQGHIFGKDISYSGQPKHGQFDDTV
jgi:hypothetical protein